MARSGLGKPKPDEIAAAKEKLGKYTPSGRRRRFTGGLTQEAVAYLLEVDDRTVRHYIAECKCHIEGKSAARIVEVAALPINLWRAVQEYLSQQGGRPEE